MHEAINLLSKASLLRLDSFLSNLSRSSLSASQTPEWRDSSSYALCSIVNEL